MTNTNKQEQIYEDLQSKTINFLRFPLSVAVVLIHVGFPIDGGVDSAPVYMTIRYLFSDIIARIAVPLFFLISGFLFFYKAEFFSKKTYGLKLKKRLKTLLVPYLFWNGVALACLVLSQLFIFEPQYDNPEFKSICDYGFSDWVAVFWTHRGGDYPIDIPLWFVRDLMVVMLLSPLIYFLLKKLRIYALVVLGAFWLSNVWFSLSGFSIAAFFFFSVGAYLSLYRKNLVKIMSPWLLVSSVLYAVIVVCLLCFRDQQWSVYLGRVGILVGMVLAVSLSSHFLKKGFFKVNLFLSGSSFFIFAYHIIPLRALLPRSQLCSEVALLTSYVIFPLVVIGVGLFIYFILKKYFPKTTEIIVGGR